MNEAMQKLNTFLRKLIDLKNERQVIEIFLQNQFKRNNRQKQDNLINNINSSKFEIFYFQFFYFGLEGTISLEIFLLAEIVDKNMFPEDFFGLEWSDYCKKLLDFDKFLFYDVNLLIQQHFTSDIFFCSVDNSELALIRKICCMHVQIIVCSCVVVLNSYNNKNIFYQFAKKY
eukprot:TRINITY_DN1616_c0_g1_i3.p3 TRINITY_DN1616_c0_g1~~TRINITY_DN1616_c0_g1_i3.p3  ORF type:complete len:173 (-),score=14.97 TRINITY_DN1616_c0_g1_i3:649-1167(-)